MDKMKKLVSFLICIISVECIRGQSSTPDVVMNPPSTGNMDIVNPTFPTPSTPKCDIMNSVSCLQTLSRAQQAAVNQNQADSAQAVDSLCRSMDAAFMCIGDKLMGCKGKRRLLYDTAVSAGRFLCNGNGRRGFVENYQCLFSEKFKNSSEGCSTNVVTGIVDYVMRSTVTTSGSNDPAEMCRMGQDVSMCIIKTSRKACGENSVTFLRDYLAAAMSPLRQMLACDTPAAIQATPPEAINTVPILPETTPTEQPTTSTTTTQIPTTSTMLTTTTQAPTTTTTRRPTTTSPVAPIQPVTLQTVTSAPVGVRSDVRRPITRPPFFSLPPRRRRRRCYGCVANRRNAESLTAHFDLNTLDSVCALNFASSRSQYCPEGICMRTRSCPRSRSRSRRVICYAVGPLKDLEDSDTWCQRQCPRGACSDNVRSLCNCVLVTQL